MWPVSSRFLDEVRQSHRVVSWVEILGRDGEVVSGWSEASVTLDGMAPVRGVLSMKITDPSGYYLDRGRVTDPLSRFGAEVRPWRGVRYGDGRVEAVPLGTFRIESNLPAELASGWELTVAGRDRSAIVSRKNSRPIVITNGTKLNDAIRTIVLAMYPQASFNLADVPWRTGTMLIEPGSDPWSVAVQLANASGMLLYCDRLGVFTTSTGLAPNDPVVWMFDEGERCTFTEAPTVGRGTRQDIPNGFIVKGSSAGSTSVGIHGEAWDMDPSSPTYRYGPYGENVEIIQSDKVTSMAQAQQAAEVMLRQAKGQAVSLGANVVPNPALDPYDVSWVRRSAMDVNGPFYLSSLSIPLDAAGTMGVNLGQHDAGFEAPLDDLVTEAATTSD